MTANEHQELNQWIAKNVFGLKLNANGMIETWPRGKPISGESDFRHPRNDLCVDSYTTDPAAAMEVLKKIGEQYKDDDCFYLGKTETDEWIIGMERKRIECASETLELAICLFAKKLFSK